MKVLTLAKPASPEVRSGFQQIPLSQLVSNPDQPRKTWDQGTDEEDVDAISRLADSIRAEGIIQPLLVTPFKDGKFKIVCGERRFRAAQKARLIEAPCIVRSGLSDAEVLELSITENLQREDLTPVDEAHALRTLVERCHYTQKEVGHRLGLSVAAVNYKLSLLKLTPELQKDVRRGSLTETQGREIVHAATNGTTTTPERDAVMRNIKERIDKVRHGNGKPLSTKDVASIARSVAKEHPKAGPKGKAGSSVRAAVPRVKPTLTKLPSPAERRKAKGFLQVLARSTKAFVPFSLNGDAGLRFASVLLSLEPDVRADVKKLHGFLFVILEALDEMKRQRILAKASA